MLDASASPVYVLDEQRRLVFGNPACAAWVGVPLEELIGRKCSYHWPAEGTPAEVAAAGLCPPPEVLAGERQRAPVYRATSDGQPPKRMASFVPLGDPTDGGAIVAFVDASDEPAEEAAIPPADISPESLHEQLAAFRQLLSGRYGMQRLVGDSPAMKLAREQIALAAESKANVLIHGPAGSGRQHVARAIHHARHGADAAFAPLACSALPGELLSSTLQAMFIRTSERASQHAGQHAGELRPAETVLLRDIHGMPPEVQAELAAMLARPHTAVSVLVTSSAPLAELAAEGSFRHDLACLLSTLSIHLPPLAERMVDLPLLAQALIEEINREGRKQVAGITPEALDQLATYDWPGNVDELSAMLKQAHAHTSAAQIAVDDLPARIRLTSEAASRLHRSEEPIRLEEFLARVERELIERALRRSKGNKSKAARLLGLARPRLYRRLVQLGLEQEPSLEQSLEAGFKGHEGP